MLRDTNLRVMRLNVQKGYRPKYIGTCRYFLGCVGSSRIQKMLSYYNGMRSAEKMTPHSDTPLILPSGETLTGFILSLQAILEICGWGYVLMV